ncbi:hypothetical protein KKG72_02920 [bacterium]|nr:hypothetical protein [bacterium]MBU1994214.1 hypothetical protein [bacterium]
MKILSLMIGLSIFIQLFYGSFVSAQDIFNPQELIFMFYVFLLSGLLFFHKHVVLKSKKEMYGLVMFHIILSITLIYIGAYTFCIVMQFVFLLTLFKNNKTFFLFLYLLGVHKALLFMFGSTEFILYFLNMACVIFLLYKEEMHRSEYKFYVNAFKSRKVLLACGTIMTVFFLLSFKEFIYDVYIWLDVTDAQNFLDEEIGYVLAFLHTFMFASLVVKMKNKVSFKVV